MLDGNLRFVKEPLKQGYSFPFSVYLTEQEEIIIGQAAENNRLRDIRRYRQQFKRELGISQPYPLGDRCQRRLYYITNTKKMQFLNKKYR
jgi:molecular chaperone DnaK (HSP70)